MGYEGRESSLKDVDLPDTPKILTDCLETLKLGNLQKLSGHKLEIIVSSYASSTHFCKYSLFLV
jgi:hypothetical protein